MRLSAFQLKVISLMNEGWELRRNLTPWFGRSSDWHLKHQQNSSAKFEIEFMTVNRQTATKLLQMELIHKSKRIDLTTEQYILTDEGRKIAKEN